MLSPLELFALFALMLALYAWGRWVSRRQRARVFRLATLGVLVGIGIGLAGALWMLHELSSVHVDPTKPAAHDAAAQLAAHTSRTIAIAAWPVGIGNLVLLASIIVLLVGTLRAPDRVRPEA